MSALFSQSPWAALAIAGVVVHFVLFAMLHVLEPQLGIRSSIISDYGATASARLATLAYLAFAAIWLALAIGLGDVSARGPWLTIGRSLFLLAVVGIVTGAVLPASTDPRTPSLLARFQNLVSRPGLFLGIVIVSVGLRGATGFGDLWPKLLGLALATAALLPVTILVLLDRGLGGLGQRAIFLLVYGWVVLLGLRLGSLGGRA